MGAEPLQQREEILQKHLFIKSTKGKVLEGLKALEAELIHIDKTEAIEHALD